MQGNEIFRVVGIGLLMLGALSGVALFFKASFGTAETSESSMATLWGLFILGLAGGLILIFLSFQQ